MTPRTRFLSFSWPQWLWAVLAGLFEDANLDCWRMHSAFGYAASTAFWVAFLWAIYKFANSAIQEPTT